MRAGGTILARSKQKSPHPARCARHPPRQRAGGLRPSRCRDVCIPERLRGGDQPKQPLFTKFLQRLFTAPCGRPTHYPYLKMLVRILAWTRAIVLQRSEFKVVTVFEATGLILALLCLCVF